MPKGILSIIFTLLFVLVKAGYSQTSSGVKGDIKKPFINKKGVCITLRTPGKDKKGKTVKGDYLKNMPRVKKLNVGWNYSWGIKIQPTQSVRTSFAPMLYSVYGNPSIEHVAMQIRKSLAPARERQRQTVLMGFNEPDKKNQANLSVEKALKYWKSMEAQNLPLCSPSTVHPDNQWMKDFMKGVEKKGLRVDYIGVHDYGNGNVEAFKSKLRKIYKMYGNRPILITEFAVADWYTPTIEKNKHSPEKVLKYMQQMSRIGLWVTHGFHLVSRVKMGHARRFLMRRVTLRSWVSFILITGLGIGSVDIGILDECLNYLLNGSCS